MQISSVLDRSHQHSVPFGLLGEEISPLGEVFGWIMAVIYMGGRLPQILLNVWPSSILALCCSICIEHLSVQRVVVDQQVLLFYRHLTYLLCLFSHGPLYGMDVFSWCHDDSMECFQQWCFSDQKRDSWGRFLRTLGISCSLREFQAMWVVTEWRSIWHVFCPSVLFYFSKAFVLE